MFASLVPLHLGALHPVEQVLTLVLAFGPFLVLGIVIVLRRRADEAHEAEAGAVAETRPEDGQLDR
ncbi:hypothetical protein BH11ACT8_BH11ACT8_09430 [soil metagenome]